MGGGGLEGILKDSFFIEPRLRGRGEVKRCSEMCEQIMI